ncbi:MAG: Na/Pi cotransporter family protein [Ileibacterium sp.]|nr:Na/Pi cotransporter family protein [Ileibacterium sp.]
MSFEILTSILSFLGGLGMFIYGMNLMADGLQQSAGSKTRKLLAMLTNNRLVGVLIGALITAIIQSSSATTVMVVGFVNAQIMNLGQAIGVIMGANIGTTMTGWIVSMSEWGKLFKPEMIAPVLIFTGTAIMLFTKKERVKQISTVLVGFGILFVGLSIMSGAIEPYSEEPIFYDAFTIIGSNPLYGLLVGTVVTAVIQSSSASMGILQTLAFAGVVNWGAAAFIALGQNIGTCATALLSCIGASKNAKRAAVLHLMFNILGSVIVGTVVYIYFMMNPAVASSQVTGTQLAIFHTSFNVITTILLFPFANWMVKLSEQIIPEDDEEDTRLVKLDDRLLQSPGFALAAVKQEVTKMGELCLDNIAYSRDALVNHENILELEDNERMINTYQKELTDFLTELDASALTEREQMQLKHALMIISDLERISDHCFSIAWEAQNVQHGTELSHLAVVDLETISSQCYKTLKYTLRLRDTKDLNIMDKVLKHETKVDAMEHSMRESCIQRMAEGSCQVQTGLLFLDAISNYERIADHAELIAQYIEEEERNQPGEAFSFAVEASPAI